MIKVCSGKYVGRRKLHANRSQGVNLDQSTYL